MRCARRTQEIRKGCRRATWRERGTGSSTTLAECLEVASVVDDPVPLSRHVALRHPFRISCVLRAHRISRVPLYTATVRTLRSRRSGMRGCVDVDLRHDRLPCGRGDSQHTPALAAQQCSALGGYLVMSAEPMLAALEVPVVERRRVVESTALADYWKLTKTADNFLIVISPFASF